MIGIVKSVGMAAPKNMFPRPGEPEFSFFGLEVPLTMIEFTPFLIAFVLGIIARKANTAGVVIILFVTATFWVAAKKWIFWLEVGRVGTSRLPIDTALFSVPLLTFYLAFISGVTSVFCRPQGC